MLDIILLLLAVLGFVLLTWFCSAYCLPGIRRVRNRQNNENITATDVIFDCFLESRRNLLASKTSGRLEREAGFSRKFEDYLPLISPEIQHYISRRLQKSLEGKTKVADQDYLQTHSSKPSRQRDHILSIQKPLETAQYTEEKLSSASVGSETSVNIPDKIKTDLF